MGVYTEYVRVYARHAERHPLSPRPLQKQETRGSSSPDSSRPTAKAAGSGRRVREGGRPLSGPTPRRIIRSAPPHPAFSTCGLEVRVRKSWGTRLCDCIRQPVRPPPGLDMGWILSQPADLHVCRHAMPCHAMWCFFFASRRRAACLSACQHPAVCWWRVFCPPSHRGRKCRYTNPAAASPTFLGLLWRGGEDRLQQTEALQPHGGPVNDSRSEREAQQRRRRVTVATSLPKKTAGAGRERGVRGWACFGSRHEPRISVARTPVGCAKLRSTDKDYPAPTAASARPVFLSRTA